MDMLGGSSNNASNAMSFPSGNDDGGFGDFQGNNSAAGQPINMQSGTNPTNMT